MPPLFRLIHGITGTDMKEMYKVFNMGHRMELYLPERHAAQVIAIAKSFNIPAQVVGRVERMEGKRVTLKGAGGTFVY